MKKTTLLIFAYLNTCYGSFLVYPRYCAIHKH